MRPTVALIWGLAFALLTTSAYAVSCPELTPEQQSELIALHMPSGAPSDGTLYVRRGYVMAYDEANRVPHWAAWKAQKSFRSTPRRDGRWSSFRKDKEVPNGVVTTEYTGLFDSADNFARGHIVPYFISGGDRDGDGMDAEFENQDNLPIEDIDDACTVFEINHMSNIAPQYHERFNGEPVNGETGLWYELETKMRGKIDAGSSFHMIAGTIFGDEPIQRVGNPNDNKPDNIGVPHMFFKLVIGEGGMVPFLFVHQKRVSEFGCELTDPLEECIVTVDQLETASGLKFSPVQPDPKELWASW